MEKNILINEIFPDPIGADQGYEWLEIVNTTEETIDISQWEIEGGGVKYSRIYKFPNETKINPGEYLLVCEQLVENCNYYTNLLGMQNGRGKTDGVRILNANGEIIDTILYSKPNINNLKNDFGEIEDDENIIGIPPEGHSISRRNFQDTNFSILDFFSTNSPTPGEKNTEPNTGKIIISEIYTNFIEFYSPNPPVNTNQWYVLLEDKKIYLENTLKNNFFVLETEKDKKDIQLYSPENVVTETFSKERISPHYSYCRINSLIEDEFLFCEPTKGKLNNQKNWEHKKILEIVQIGKETEYIIKPCVVYKYGEIHIISDKTYSIGVNCIDCEINKCYTSELLFNNNEESELLILKEENFEDINIDFVNKENHIELLNNVVKIEAEYLKSDSDFSYFSTKIGNFSTKKGEYSKNIYTLQGIWKRKNSQFFELQYPITLKKETFEEIKTLESTGPPIFIIIIFLIFCFKILCLYKTFKGHLS